MSEFTELELKVLEFAKKCHGEQKRKYTLEPYWHHVKEVAEIVKTADYYTENMLLGALLHDVLEDTKTTKENLREFFIDLGFSISKINKILYIVESLTDVSKPEDGNRAFRKERDRLHLASGHEHVMTIKLADIISNTKSIIEHDKKFAEIYIPEKIELLKVLKNGDDKLYRRACYECYKAEIELGIE